jgi:hypothetical protein
MENPMMRIIPALAVVALLGAPAPALLAQPQQSVASVPASAAYKPKLADIMLMLQIRHAKLSLAGEAQNWPLAEFQVEELKEAFEDAETHYPVFKDIPVKQMIESAAAPAVIEIEKAIAAKDRAGFVRAFENLTTACNHCHQGASRPFFVIQRPAVSPFPNQSFAPAPN